MNARVRAASAFVALAEAALQTVVLGQQAMLGRLMVGLLADGHILLEGLPGLAKTLAVRALASVIDCRFQRIQFTPDLLPADLVGTMIYNQKTAEFTVQRGPIFGNIILADEINRAPAKVQSALLEAMQEKQVTIGGQSFPLDEPFLVLATQNPIEHEGTYPLPEAQIDRFMLKLIVTYPGRRDESEMLDRMTGPPLPAPSCGRGASWTTSISTPGPRTTHSIWSARRVSRARWVWRRWRPSSNTVPVPGPRLPSCAPPRRTHSCTGART
jgi:MoxR-like ATPase